MFDRVRFAPVLLALTCAVACLFAPAGASAVTPSGCQSAGVTADPSSSATRVAGDDPALDPGAPICDGTSYDYDYPEAVGATDAPAVAVGGGTSGITGELPRTGAPTIVGLIPVGLVGFLAILAGITLCCVPTRRSNNHA